MFPPKRSGQRSPIFFTTTLIALLLALGSPSLGGQERMNGRVLLGDSALSQGMVVLHSVSAGAAGDIDSMRVDGEGRFGFTLQPSSEDGDPTEIYFASVRHQGVLYFGPAVVLSQPLDSLYVIEVFDSEVAPTEGLPLPVAIRNVVMEEGEDGSWLVTDIMQIHNDRARTIVAADSGVVWSHPLPRDALDVEIGQGDLAPDAVDFVDGRIVVRAPLPPGERFVLARYRIEKLPTNIPVVHPTAVMDLLVKEPAPPVTAPPLEAVTGVAIEENSYRRYTGQNLAATGAVTVRVEEAAFPEAFPVGWTVVLFAFVLTGAGLYVYYRPSPQLRSVVVALPREEGPTPPAPPGPPQSSGRGATVVEIARLDERMSGLGEDACQDREALQTVRSQLMERLRSWS